MIKIRKTTALSVSTLMCAITIALSACKSPQAKSELTAMHEPVGPAFNADSAYAFCQKQCDFGPRVMNSAAHERCGKWISDKFREFGCTVIEQRAALRGYDETLLKATNIIASYRPELTTRILLCAHWDSRPWADNDADERNWRKPIDAANDGASGVAVLLEIARLLQSSDSLQLGVDFICFDAEDWGTPQFASHQPEDGRWALGSRFWASNPHQPGYEARFGILLDMVGGSGARFFHEGFSKRYAQHVIDKVWTAAQTVGFGSYFPKANGGYVTDDHVPVNERLKIPTIDIIPYYPDCKESSFGHTWHTMADNMENIDKNTLRAVGQTVVQVLFSE